MNRISEQTATTYANYALKKIADKRGNLDIAIDNFEINDVVVEEEDGVVVIVVLVEYSDTEHAISEYETLMNRPSGTSLSGEHSFFWRAWDESYGEVAIEFMFLIETM